MPLRCVPSLFLLAAMVGGPAPLESVEPGGDDSGAARPAAVQAALEEAEAARSEAQGAAAVTRLAHLGPEGFAALQELARSPDATVRSTAIIGLKQVRNGEAALELARLFQDPDENVAVAALVATADGVDVMGVSDGVLALTVAAIEAAGEARPRVVALLLDLAKELGSPANAPLARRLLDSSDSGVVRAAASLLGVHGAPLDLPRLGGLAHHPASATAAAALRACGQLLGNPPAPRLLDLLETQDPALHDFAVVALRSYAIRSQDEVSPFAQRDERLRPTLRRLLASHPDSLVRLDALRTLRLFVTNLLGFHDDPEDLALVARRLGLERDPLVRTGLLEFAASASTRAIQVKLQGYEEALPAASRTLVHWPVDDVVFPILLRGLADREAGVRAMAVAQLEDLSGLSVAAGSETDTRSAWTAWWREQSLLTPDERTNGALEVALADLESGGSAEAWLPGLTYVTLLSPPPAPDGRYDDGPTIAAAYRGWLSQRDGATVAERLADGLRGSTPARLSARSLHRVARLANLPAEPRALLGAAEWDAFLDRVAGRPAPAPAARVPWLYEFDDVPNEHGRRFSTPALALDDLWLERAAKASAKLAADVPGVGIFQCYACLTAVLADPASDAAAAACDAATGAAGLSSAARRVVAACSGRAALARGDTRAAVRQLTAARLESLSVRELDSAVFLASLSEALRRSGQVGPARRAAQAALALDPDCGPALLALALLEPDPAARKLLVDAGMRRAPTCPGLVEEALHLAAAAGNEREQESLQRRLEAVQTVVSSVQAGPLLPDSQAAVTAVAVLDAAGADSTAYQALAGRVLMAARQGRPALARLIDHFARGGRDAGARMVLAQAYETLGDVARAYEHVTLAMRDNPALAEVFRRDRDRVGELLAFRQLDLAARAAEPLPAEATPAP